MGIKKKVAKKVINSITKNVGIDKMLDGAIDKVSDSIEKGITNSGKIIQETKEKKIRAKEKKIEEIKNYKVKNNSEDIIEFFIEAKKNIKTKNIDDEEYNMWFLKIDEVYEKAQEYISDEKNLEKVRTKYEELKRIKKLKNYIWIVFLLIYVFIGSCVFFGLKGMFWFGLGIGILIGTIITFIYFNIDFTNIKQSIKEFKFKETTENMICYGTLALSILILFYGGLFSFIEKEEENEGYKNYYDENVEKYDVSISINFKENLLFNQCDITLNLYDEEEFFEHGKDKTIKIKLPKGTHKLEFSSDDDTEIEKINVEGDTKVKYKLECLVGGIEVTQVSKSN